MTNVQTGILNYNFLKFNFKESLLLSHAGPALSHTFNHRPAPNSPLPDIGLH